MHDENHYNNIYIHSKLLNKNLNIDTISLFTTSIDLNDLKNNPLLEKKIYYDKYKINRLKTYNQSLIVSLSIPVFLYGDNYRSLSHDDYLSMVNKLNNIFHYYGINTNIEFAKISSIDIFKDICLDFSATYIEYTLYMRENNSC